MATYNLNSRVGKKINNKKVEEVCYTSKGRKYLKSLHNGKYNVTLSDEVLRFIEYQNGYDAGIVDSQRKCINELEEILEALAENTTDSNKRMAESGLSLIDSFKEETSHGNT